MNVDMTRSLAFTFCTIDAGPAIAVQKRSCGAESFSDGLETEYRFQIDLETWGENNVDNNVGGDIKVDIKVDNKVDNNVCDDTVNRSRIDQEITDDTVNDTVPQTRTRTTIPYNIRTSPVQHPYKTRGVGPDKGGRLEVIKR